MAPNDFRPGLRPPQFSLRTLLLVVALCGVFCALANVLPPLMIAGLIFLAITIAAHIIGNALGTQLRKNGSRAVDSAGQPISASQPFRGVSAFAPQTELSERRSLGWPMLVVTASGLVLGGTGGGLLAAQGGREIVTLSIVIGVIAFGALGGFAAFLAFSFARVGIGAILQALAGARQADKL